VKVCLVDDDSEEAELFSEAVKEIDSAIEVLWFDGVMNAFDSLKSSEGQPDLIFIDLNIPRLSGKELLKMLRTNSSTVRLPVVIYSTSISKKDIEDTSPFNVAFYLQKPETFSVLRLKLAEVFSKIQEKD